MNKLLIALSLVAMLGCSKQTSESSDEFVLPDGLKDCKVFRMDNGRMTHVIVVRCPNSSTSVRYGGKHQWNTMTTDETVPEKETVTINGKEYVEK